MKNIFKTSYIIVAAMLISTAAFAQQNLRSAYFLDGYTYGYKMNPAFAPERSFFAFPMLGNTGIGIESNLGLSTFLYPTADGKLTTFLNSSITDEQFLSKINNLNQMNMSLNESLLAVGYRIGKSFHTIDLSFKSDWGAVVPKGLFAFMKTGSADGQYSWDISNIGFRANARMELAYGYQRSIGKNLRVGARLKLLAGLARTNILVDNLNLTMNGQQWTVKAHGDAAISGPVRIGTKEGSNELNLSDIRTPETMEEFTEYLSSPSIGAAIDLGASFDFLKYFTASLSVLDLGFVSWNGTTTAVMPGGEWKFDGFENLGSSDGSVDDQLSALGDELAQMLKMEKVDDYVKKNSMLSATIHAGIEARMPFYERLSFGLLATQRIDGPYSWTEGRLIANLAPVNWFSLAGSYAYSNFGNSLGGVINIHLPGFNLYAGLDSFLPMSEVTPQYVPVNALNTNMTFGLTFTFGKAVSRYRKAAAK